MTLNKMNERITCGPAAQDWCDLTVLKQGFAPIHIKNWSDTYEKQPHVNSA